MKSTILKVFVVVFVVSCKTQGADEKPSELPTVNNEQLGLRASDCGIHEWYRTTSKLGTVANPWPSVKDDSWTSRYANIGFDLSSSFKSLGVASNANACENLQRVFTSGQDVWKGSTTLSIGSVVKVEPGQTMGYGLTFNLEARDSLPVDLNILAEQISQGQGKNIPIQNLETSLNFTIKGPSSETMSGLINPKAKLELVCKTPFTQSISFVDKNSSMGEKALCRKKANGSPDVECLFPRIDFTGDACIFKAYDLQVIGNVGEKIDFDAGGTLTKKDQAGNQYYELMVSSITLK